jgi:hypothetical protein
LRVAATTGVVTERMETSRRQNTEFMPRTLVHKKKKLKIKKQAEHQGRKKNVMESKTEKKENINSKKSVKVKKCK